MDNRIGSWGGRTPSIARRRYQHGSLSKEGDRWLGRWREDDATSDNDYGLVFVTDPGRSKRKPRGKTSLDG